MKNTQKIFTLAFMSLVLIFLNADGNVINPNITMIEKEFGVTDAHIGAMMGLFTVIGAIISILWGYMADKTKRKTLFVLSVLIGEIPCLLTAFAKDWVTFYILRILTGIGVGAAFPLVFSMIGDIYGEESRPLATAILTTAFSVGQIIGILLAGFTTNIQAGILTGWRLSFLLASSPNIPLVILFYFLIPEPKRGASEKELADLIEKGIIYPKTIKLEDYKGLIKIKTNIYLFLQGILGTIPWGAIAFLNKFLEDIKGFKKEVATLIFLIFAVGNVAGTVLGGYFGGILSKKNLKYLPRFCSVTTAVGAFFIILIYLYIPSNFILISLTGIFVAFLISMTGPNMRSMLLDTNVPENRGAIFSIFNLTDSLGMGFGKWVAGILSVAISLTYSLTVCSIFWFGCAIILWFTATPFINDVKTLHEKLKNIATTMSSK
ncbi:MAG: MFS transporter [Spirochaetes bacterium]|nr:MFS transporter [Spirochaetota bacterium]